jgi:hypothetical protein
MACTSSLIPRPRIMGTEVARRNRSRPLPDSCVGTRVKRSRDRYPRPALEWPGTSSSRSGGSRRIQPGHAASRGAYRNGGRSPQSRQSRLRVSLRTCRASWPLLLPRAVFAGGMCDGGYGVAAAPSMANPTSALSEPVPVETTTNCLPERVRYVIGFAPCGYGILPRQISFPVFLSNAYR